MRAFLLIRDEDPSEVSGVGVVAEGVEFEDGHVAVRWCVGDARSVSVWDSIEDAQAIHGHHGLTRFEFADDITWGPA